MMIITFESHLDHGLSTHQVAELLAKYKEKDGFFIDSFKLPGASLDCALHGPAMGDAPVRDSEVSYACRGKRLNSSRLCDRAPRRTDLITVIAGPDEVGNKCVLYTVYGGPCAPKEPTDPNLKPAEDEASSAFWAEHALSK
jgi:hypothetical protein